MRSFVRVLEGPVGDALGVLAAILFFGWVGYVQDAGDPVQLGVGQACTVMVMLLTAYAGYQLWLMRSPLKNGR